LGEYGSVFSADCPYRWVIQVIRRVSSVNYLGC
jgi:hypothetical protein